MRGGVEYYIVLLPEMHDAECWAVCPCGSLQKKDVAPQQGQLVSLGLPTNHHHIRRIYTEEKAKVVDALWGTYLNATLPI